MPDIKKDAVEAIAKLIYKKTNVMNWDNLTFGVKGFYRTLAKAILSLPEVRQYFNKGE